MIVNVFGYAEKLEKSGFTKSQAEASLQVLVEIMNQEFATKEDVRGLSHQLHVEVNSLRKELHSEISSLRNELHSEISLVRSDLDKLGDKLTIRMGTMMIAGLTIMFGMLQLTINK